ncbi:MAG: hypothetical protein U5J78_06295 [Parasphingorhabdus sp.]|nr:hypothetical protein [Parasphingorhabdus sp.]
MTSLILLRAFAVPAQDVVSYYEYFSFHPNLYLSNTLLGAPFRIIQGEHIALVIGQDKWGYGTSTFANTGIFGSAYMQFGVWGMIIYPIAVMLLLKWLDKLVTGKFDPAVGITLTVIPIMQFIQGDLTTVLLSSGFALCVVSLYVIEGKGSRLTPQWRSGSPAIA